MTEQRVKSKGIFHWYFGTNLLKRIIIGLVAGGVLGVILAYTPDAAKTFVSYSQIFGDIFIRLLKMIVVPVIFFSLITGAASIAPAQLGRVGIKTLRFYLVLVLFAISIGLIMSNIFKPGLGFNLLGAAEIQGKTTAAPSLSTIFLNIVPTNPIEALAKGDVLPIIFFALVFGISLSLVRNLGEAAVAKSADLLFHVCSACAETMYKVVGGIMQYAPIGVFVLIANVFAIQGPKALGPLLFVTVLTYVCFFLHVFIGFGGALALFGLNLFKFLRGAQEAMVTSFVTRSSSATLPVSLRVSEENLGVPRSVSSFSLPIGATINMDGTAIYLSVCAMFIGFATNQPLTMDQQITVMITATLGAVGTAGVPGAGAIMLLLVLESVGLKVEAGSAVAAAYAMILGIDALMDMGRTCLNVTGDMAGSAIVAKTEGELEKASW